VAEPYLGRLKALITKTTDGRYIDVEFDCRHFFGGAAAYANGNIFASLTPVGLALKLPPDAQATVLKMDGASPLRYFPKAPIKKEYAVLPSEIVEDIGSCHYWFDISVTHVLGAPN